MADENEDELAEAFGKALAKGIGNPLPGVATKAPLNVGR